MQQTNFDETSYLLLHDVLIQNLVIFSISKVHDNWIKVAEQQFSNSSCNWEITLKRQDFQQGCKGTGTGLDVV